MSPDDLKLMAHTRAASMIQRAYRTFSKNKLMKMAGEALNLDQQDKEERQRRADALLAIDFDALCESTSEIKAFDDVISRPRQQPK